MPDGFGWSIIGGNTLHSMDTYNGQLTLKYSDTDTIYCYDDATNQLLPQYAIFTDEKKGDYEATHLWFKDRKSFDYFSIFSITRLRILFIRLVVKARRYIPIAIIKKMEVLDCRNDKAQ